MSEREWVTESLKFYRPLNFFADRCTLADEQLADDLIARRIEAGSQDYLETFLEAKAEAEQEHEEWEIVAPEAIADMVLLAHDENRVWWDDGETDICPGDDIYVKVLRECSRISRGAFVISDIEEEWKDGVLSGVLFSWKDERWQVFPNAESSGWIDFSILEQINPLLQNSGTTFLGHWAGDQTTFIVALTQDEKRKFESQRHWSFYDSLDEM